MGAVCGYSVLSTMVFGALSEVTGDGVVSTAFLYLALTAGCVAFPSSIIFVLSLLAKHGAPRPDSTALTSGDSEQMGAAGVTRPAAPTFTAEELAAFRAKSHRQNLGVLGVIFAFGGLSALFFAPPWVRYALLVILGMAGWAMSPASLKGAVQGWMKPAAPFVVAGIAALIWFCATGNSGNEKAAQEAVLGELKAPSTAHFVSTEGMGALMGGSEDPAPDRPTASIYHVVVDAENGLGVSLRSGFCVILEGDVQPVVWTCPRTLTPEQTASTLSFFVTCRKVGMDLCRAGAASINQ